MSNDTGKELLQELLVRVKQKRYRDEARPTKWWDYSQDHNFDTLVKFIEPRLRQVTKENIAVMLYCLDDTVKKLNLKEYDIELGLCASADAFMLLRVGVSVP